MYELSVITIEGYDSYRRNRGKARGGGVCAYVRNDVTCHIYCPAAQRTASRPDAIEILWFECFFACRHYYIACCYHPPRPKYKYSQNA